MTALRKLHLYGDFAVQFGAEHEVAASTIGEAIRIVDCNHVGFAHAMRRRYFHTARGDGRISYSSDNIALGDSGAQELLPHQLTIPRSDGDWHLIPAFQGSKSGGFKTVFSVVLGGALLATGIGGAVAAGTGGLSGAAFGAGAGFAGLSFGTVALLGAGIFLGGLNMLLAPTPQTDTANRDPTAFGFDGPSEVDDEGGPIHIIIGEVVAPPIRIASSITTGGTANNNGRDGINNFNPKGGGGGRFDGYVQESIR